MQTHWLTCCAFCLCRSWWRWPICVLLYTPFKRASAMMIAKYRANNQAEGDSNMLIKSLMENKKKKKRKKTPFLPQGNGSCMLWCTWCMLACNHKNTPFPWCFLYLVWKETSNEADRGGGTWFPLFLCAPPTLVLLVAKVEASLI